MSGPNPPRAARLLIIGASHVHVLHDALAEGPRAKHVPSRREPGYGRVWRTGEFEIEVVSMWAAGPLADGETLRLDRRDWDPRPDLICIGMGANLHNVIGLFETPQPFRLGARDGAVPPLRAAGEAVSDGRSFVPRGLMTAWFERRLARFDGWCEAVHRHFPDAGIFHMAGPPPARASHRELAAMFDKGGDMDREFGLRVPDDESGLPPPMLQLSLWELQAELEAGRAARLGAPFLWPAEEARDEDGHLSRGFWDADPTHGNLAYGRLMLDRLLDAARERAP